jgi:hypothetical protein
LDCVFNVELKGKLSLLIKTRRDRQGAANGTLWRSLLRFLSETRKGEENQANLSFLRRSSQAESITEGTLKQWSKQVGDFVKQDEEIATIETDKVRTGFSFR